jgi:hypothetical protein
MSVADARDIMFTIHRERRKRHPWATVQSFERDLEWAVANDEAVVLYELRRIERATELDAPSFLDDWARKIIERDNDAR